MGYLEIKLTLNRGQRPDLEKAATLYAQAIERMSIQVATGKVDNVGSTIRFRSDGVTGLTDKEAMINASFLPGNAKTAGMLNLTVSQHPDGPDGAAEMANSLADRIAEAFSLQLGKVYKSKPKRNSSYHILRAANGWNGEFQSVFADYKPDGVR
jgi:hypothetical protein